MKNTTAEFFIDIIQTARLRHTPADTHRFYTVLNAARLHIGQQCGAQLGAAVDINSKNTQLRTILDVICDNIIMEYP